MRQIFSRKRIGEILSDKGDLNPSDIPFIVEYSKTKGERFGRACVANSMISEEALAQALAEQFGMEYVNIKGFKMDESILNTLPADAIYRYHFIPLEESGNSLIIAIDDPTEVVKLDELEVLLDRPLVIKLATQSAIEAVMQKGEGPAGS
jgi:type IV pilus assembly protein PilB